MTLRSSVPVAAAWILLAGCGQETGLLIEITRDDSVPADLGRLQIGVGVDEIPGQETRFLDPDPLDDVSLEGRDLADDPYRLFLRPRDYPDARLLVAAVAYRSGEPVGFGRLEEPVRFVDGELARWRIVLTDDLPDRLDTTDTDCLTWFDEESGRRVTIGQAGDKDCDRYPVENDCDDLDPDVNPGANEDCENGIDDDCDEATDENVDEDGDQVTTCGGDCNDGDDRVFPGATEECDGIDNDCNDLCDDEFDPDGDLYTGCGSVIAGDGATCDEYDPERFDCEELDPDINPGAAEVCDGIDNDCDGSCDNAGSDVDPDGDGYTECGSIVEFCERVPELYFDCQPDNGDVHPAAVELCNGVDDDCDGQPLQSAPCFAENRDGPGCFWGERDCGEQLGQPSDWTGDCRPDVDSANEVPVSLCQTYSSCDQADDPDPYACAFTSEGSGFEIPEPCTVRFEVATGAQCGAPVVVLPAGKGQLDCTRTVVGGVSQGDYEVGFASVDLPDQPQPQRTLDACAALLVVRAKRAGAASRQLVVLAFTDRGAGETTYQSLLINAAPTDTCLPPRGLECGTLLPPPPP